MTEWHVGEDTDLREYVEQPEVRVGDIINFIANNQEGFMRYRVIMQNGRKFPQPIEDIYGPLFDDEDYRHDKRPRERRYNEDGTEIDDEEEPERQRPRNRGGRTKRQRHRKGYRHHKSIRKGNKKRRTKRRSQRRRYSSKK